MLNSTIWVSHDPEASARAHDDPVAQLRGRVYTMEHNLATLRTRLTQVADLRDAQGIREDHRALVARLNEVEECASVHALREFMSKILRLEAMLSGEHGGVIGEAIRACNRRVVVIELRWMISTLGSALRIGIMTYLIRKEMKRLGCQIGTPMLKINLVWKIGHLEDEDFEVMRHSADSKEPCLDHHHHQHMTQKRQQHSLLK